jgi:DNA-binding NtrC family response regulator
MDYSWPGNVRELRNAVERAVVLCEGRSIAPFLFPFIERDITPRPPDAAAMSALPYKEAMDRMTRRCQKEYVLEMLRKCGGGVAEAAERAGITRESFYRLMRRCSLEIGRLRRELSEQ